MDATTVCHGIQYGWQRSDGQAAHQQSLASNAIATPSSEKTVPKPLFEEIPPAASGISWRHENGRSPEYYLPETTGAGCAFLDYDNDGWMDIYLVNSGKCDFFT
jgi:hypothetical protein